MDTGITKDGDTYKLSWNADKMVDVTNAYVKYVFKNPESIVNMYKNYEIGRASCRERV